MALTEGNKILASDLVALKNRVNDELKRRCRKGSVASYAAEYTNTPTSGGKALPSHINEIITPMSKINTPGVSTVSTGNLINNIDALDTKLTLWESDTMVKNGNNSCSASCTGMCVDGCWGCSGCGGSCSSSCGGDCEGGCSGCSGTCSGSCTGCFNTCTNTCTGCGGYCGGCSGTCTITCGNSCYADLSA